MIRNLVYSVAGALSSLFLFLLFVIAARVLGDGPFGLFSYALAFVFLFEYLTDLGVTDIATREVARQRGRARAYLANLLGYRTLLGLAVYALIAGAVVVVSDDPRAHRLVWILGLSILQRTFLNSARSIFRAFERFDLDALALAADRGLLLVAGTAALWATRSPEGLAWTFVAVRVVSVVLSAALLARLVPLPRPGLEWPFVGELQRQALAIGGFQIVVGAATYVDAIMLEFWRPYEEIGWYSAAFRVYLGIAMIGPLVVGAFAPRLARLSLEETRAGHHALTNALFRLYWPATCALALLGTAGAPLWIDVAYGAEYAPATPALRILMAGLALMFVSVLCTQVLISIDRQARTFPIVAAGLTLNVAANAVAIPRWGYLGAAAATVLSETLIVALFLVAARRDYRWRPPAGDVARPLAALVPAVAVLAVPGLPRVASLAAATLAYVVALALLGLPSRGEWRWLGERLGPVRASLLPRPVARRGE